MKKVLISIVLGGIITWIIYLIGRIPTTNGPNPLVLICVMPFQILALIINRYVPVGDIVYFGMQILFWSLVSFAGLSVIKRIKR